MIKKAGSSFLATLLLIGFVFPQQDFTPIREVFFVQSGEDPSDFPPQVIVGFEITANSYYKFYHKGEILNAGLFPKGFNSIALPTYTLIERDGEHIYSLELKTEAGVTATDIVIDVEMETHRIEEVAAQERLQSEYRVSMYIDNSLIASRTKTVDKKIPVKIESLNLPQNYDYFKPDQMDNPLANSVSIFQVAGLAFQIIKDLAKKDEGARIPPIQKTGQITLVFSRATEQGTEDVRAVIRLISRDR